MVKKVRSRSTTMMAIALGAIVDADTSLGAWMFPLFTDSLTIIVLK
ncbi:hypothetical protein QUA51_09740 [Microcoleus sp. Pol10_D6]